MKSSELYGSVYRLNNWLIMSDATASPVNLPPGFSMEKHRQILDAAARLFIGQGFEATTVDAIAREAGVSKATVYAHAGSKQDLFVRVLNSRCGELWQSLEAGPAEAPDVASGLREIGRNFLELILSQDGLDMYRVVVSEAGRNPELGRLFYETGPKLLIEHVAAFLDGARQRGELALEDSAQAAKAFLGILQSSHHMQRLLGTKASPTPAEVEAAVEYATALFLKAHRPG
jgi:TetR/AcrR family transcriptional repressor of mexJK operon